MTAIAQPAGVPAFSGRWSARAAAGAAFLFVAVNATLTGSYSTVKMAFLALFACAGLIHAARAGRLVVYPRLLVFFLGVTVLGFVAAIVGLLNPGANAGGVLSGLKVYCGWSLLFIVVLTLLRDVVSLRVVHWGLVCAGILIAAVNGLAIADGFLGWGIIPAGTREVMELGVGLSPEGVVRLNSSNLTALFVIVPYLLTVEMRNDAGRASSWLTHVSLALCLLTAAFSGRRALWLIAACTPLAVLLLSAATGSLGSLRKTALRGMLLGGAIVIAYLITAPLRQPSGEEAFYLQHLRQSFSASDARNLQIGYLLEGFARAPVWGSGFGAHVAMLRSDDTPWSYEISYLQLLFNVGLVGVAFLVVLYGACFTQVVGLLRSFRSGAAIPFALVIGVLALLVGAFSNPLLGSFDNLFEVGLLPLLMTYQSGFRT